MMANPPQNIYLIVEEKDSDNEGESIRREQVEIGVHGRSDVNHVRNHTIEGKHTNRKH